MICTLHAQKRMNKDLATESEKLDCPCICYSNEKFVHVILVFLSKGSGYYIYIETSRPRKMGDTARLTSPWLRGRHCMMFYYHMYGSSMGCVVVYIRRQGADRLQPLWLRSKDQGNSWIQAQVSINDTSSYQVGCHDLNHSLFLRWLQSEQIYCFRYEGSSLMTSTILIASSLPKYGDFLGIYRSKNALHNSVTGLKNSGRLNADCNIIL